MYEELFVMNILKIVFLWKRLLKYKSEGIKDRCMFIDIKLKIDLKKKNSWNIYFLMILEIDKDCYHTLNYVLLVIFLS
jgi:hypothetical protein